MWRRRFHRGLLFDARPALGFAGKVRGRHDLWCVDFSEVTRAPWTLFPIVILCRWQLRARDLTDRGRKTGKSVERSVGEREKRMPGLAGGKSSAAGLSQASGALEWVTCLNTLNYPDGGRAGDVDGSCVISPSIHLVLSVLSMV